jgi:NAD(P)-dependent dehydrogenase (short-subunit alcohol dehydrogenase family)
MQRVVISGANRGLGLALVKAYVERGDEVVAGCRTPGAAAELSTLGVDVHELDMGSPSSVERFGAVASGRPIDVVFNNAGVDGRAFGAPDSERDVLSLDPANLTAQMDVNAVGPMLLVRALLPAFRTGSRIVNISSQIGSMEVSAKMGRDVGYAVSKAALNMITVKLAWRLHDDGIIAVAVHPGYLRTDMGGSSASMDASDSALGLQALADGLTLEQSGTFLRWDGSVHPW